MHDDLIPLQRGVFNIEVEASDKNTLEEMQRVQALAKKLATMAGAADSDDLVVRVPVRSMQFRNRTTTAIPSDAEQVPAWRMFMLEAYVVLTDLGWIGKPPVPPPSPWRPIRSLHEATCEEVVLTKGRCHTPVVMNAYYAKQEAKANLSDENTIRDDDDWYRYWMPFLLPELPEAPTVVPDAG